MRGRWSGGGGFILLTTSGEWEYEENQYYRLL